MRAHTLFIWATSNASPMEPFTDGRRMSLGSSAKTAWRWAVRAAGSGHDAPDSVAFRYDGSSVVSGVFVDPVTFGATTLTGIGGHDTFVAALDRSVAWLWGSRFGSTDETYGTSVAAMRDGTVTVAGTYIGTMTVGTHTLTNASVGWYDAYIVRLASNGQAG